MSRNGKRGFLAFFFMSILLALAVSVAFVGGAGGAAKAQALPDVGKFRVGSALGEERCGFSGRAKVSVFASFNSPAWSSISECLQSAAIESEMDFFTGVLVDEAAEPDVEAVYRERDGLRVIVRGIGGGFLGCLPAGFTCQELVDLLRLVRASATSAPEKSPIYVNLLESTAVLDDLVARGEAAKAERYVALLEEFEGSSSPAVQAARAKVGR
jgi:hypothetical protein